MHNIFRDYIDFAEYFSPDCIASSLRSCEAVIGMRLSQSKDKAESGTRAYRKRIGESKLLLKKIEVILGVSCLKMIYFCLSN